MGLVRLVTTGFIFSFFWCVAGAIYLLLRQDVDDKEFDDVYVPAEAPNPRPPLSATATPPPAPEPSSLPRSEGPPDQRLVETVPAPPS